MGRVVAVLNHCRVDGFAPTAAHARGTLDGMPARVTVRYWAGARRAAGRAEESLEVETLADVRAELRSRPGLAAVSAVATLLVDGAQAPDAMPLRDGAEVDVLPPFAGG